MSTALVTGASAGIGRTFAHELAERGHDLVVVARDRSRLEDLSDELTRRHGIGVEILVADLADRSQLQRVADRLSCAERPVDLLVNNAGFGLPASLLGGDVADEERLVDVLCRAVLVLSRAAALSMRVRGRGAIVNVSSVAGYAPSGTYGAAKAWCTRFTEALATELRGSGVTATALCPGFTRTEFHQRAQLNMARLPTSLWLTADRVVRECLDDVARGRVVSVPSRRYKILVGMLQVTPHALVRRFSGPLNRARRRRSGAG